MLKITVVAVGKLKEKFWVAACDEYLKRLRPYAKVAVTEIPDVDPARAGGVEAAREREGAGILAAVPECAHVILMAIEGKQRSSVDFSRHLDDLALRGASELAFVIGGSDPVPSIPLTPPADREGGDSGVGVFSKKKKNQEMDLCTASV